jgi:hypothetical protein
VSPRSHVDRLRIYLGWAAVGGLISSTIMVLVVFPVYYLAVEKVRTPPRNLVRRRLGKPLV